MQGKLNQVSDVLSEGEEGAAAVAAYADELVQRGDIMFDRVHFSYNQEPLLQDVSFHIPGGQATAVIGYSGSGKTTLLKLLERIYEPDKGRILCGGGAINEHDAPIWRRNIAYVMQDTPLMSGTIRESLLYGIRREVSEEELWQTLQTVHLDAFVKQLPEGLETQVGQFGSRLSGGQRQRYPLPMPC